MHRWRNLESSDPQRFEMINKIQSIQKRIIAKNQEIVEKGTAPIVGGGRGGRLSLMRCCRFPCRPVCPAQSC